MNNTPLLKAPLSRNGSKRNFKSYNVNDEEQKNSDSDSYPSFDFCFNITTNILKDNYNNNSVTPRNIKINKVKAKILKEENNDKEDNKNHESLIMEKESIYPKI
ncbi:hypothetical protein LY90DRAFT_500737 [Neocallimastix californiae]|uniref:Uncharacterized protein n=1 Tax=Neocallimastix californiae TaxID=1754190 RepID=A0A1Y2F5I9_9FUNG|nr:hypothetical protein LY90DRAFT_500737 [Neocallimastix californiae]|eukprot:ORY79131.1 hypothetical protein LY90DRAFT_500737 [Neocallimastix californiae]